MCLAGLLYRGYYFRPTSPSRSVAPKELHALGPTGACSHPTGSPSAASAGRLTDARLDQKESASKPVQMISKLETYLSFGLSVAYPMTPDQRAVRNRTSSDALPRRIRTRGVALRSILVDLIVIHRDVRERLEDPLARWSLASSAASRAASRQRRALRPEKHRNLWLPSVEPW